MSNRISVMPHLLDCLAREEVVAVENVTLALKKLQFERIGMSKLVNVGIFTWLKLHLVSNTSGYPIF
jgi:hypothetical protein